MKKRWVIVGILVLLAALAVCVLPLPKRVDMELYAVELYPNGTFRSEGELSLEGWKKDRLFLQDTLELKTVDLWYAGLPDLWYLEDEKVNELSESWEWAQWFTYLETNHSFGMLTVFVNTQEQCCVMRLADKTVIASADEDFDYEALLAQVRGLAPWVDSLWK